MQQHVLHANVLACIVSFFLCWTNYVYLHAAAAYFTCLRQCVCVCIGNNKSIINSSIVTDLVRQIQNSYINFAIFIKMLKLFRELS